MIRTLIYIAISALLAIMIAATIMAGTEADKKIAQQAGEQIDWQVIAGGGNAGASASYGLSGTVGQTAAGPGTSASYGMNHGFWQSFRAASSCDPLGDASGDGEFNLGDAVFIINYIFKEGLVPDPVCCADVNCDGTINIGDAVYIVNYIFKEGPALIEGC